MKHTRKFRKTVSKSKKFRKTLSKRTTKRNRFTKRRMSKGGFTMLENWNLQKYADDSEIQQKLASHFNEPMIIGSPSKTLSLLKGLNNQYSSIKLLLKEIGVGAQSKEEEAQIVKSNIAFKKFQEKSAEQEANREERKIKERIEKERLMAERAKILEEKRKKEREQRAADEAAFYAKYGHEIKSDLQKSARRVGNTYSGISYGERRQ